MLANPVNHPLFLPTAITLGTLLAAALLGIVVSSRGDLARVRRGSLFPRWRTWAIIAPTLVLTVLTGSVTTTALALALAAQGVREYATLVQLPALYRRVLLVMTVIAVPTALLSRELYLALPPLLLILATLQPLLTQNVLSGARSLAFAALGFAYIPWLIGFVILMCVTLPGGEGLLLALALGVALSDVGAFIIGRHFGRHRLSPALSPGKTWEGTVGNMIGAGLGIALLWFALPEWMPTPARLGLPVLLALAAIWGDLVESLLKREFGVKDAGAWLPGFGGLLDRIDSLLLAVPLTYYYCILVRRLMQLPTS